MRYQPSRLLVTGVAFVATAAVLALMPRVAARVWAKVRSYIEGGPAQP